jgi:hypothetical protein
MQTKRRVEVKIVCRFEHEVHVTSTISGFRIGAADREGAGDVVDSGGFRRLSYSAR